MARSWFQWYAGEGTRPDPAGEHGRIRAQGAFTPREGGRHLPYMSERTPIEPGIEGTDRPVPADQEEGDPHASSGTSGTSGPPGADPDDFREALSHWASTVTLVAVRDDGRVHGTTATSFAPVAADPPTVLVSLGPGAQVLPFLEEGVTFVVNFLGRDQRALATRYADSYPVGPSPFATEGPPVTDGSVVSLLCEVRSVVPADGGARVVLARVTEAIEGTGGDPLLYHRRGYVGLEDDSE